MVVIRPLRKEDAAIVSEMESRTFSMPWKTEDFLDMVEADYAYYYVAEEDGVLLGCCGIRNMAGDGEITNVVVDAPYRRRGIAKKMMTHMLEQAPAQGIKDCTLEVRVSNGAAIHLYEELGFKGEGIRPGFYEKPKEDALIMWKR